MLVAKEQGQSPILSKNPREERSDLSLVVITPKATVHRFAVVRVRVKRRILGALDLVVRRGAFPSPENKPEKTSKLEKPNDKDHKSDLEQSRVLLHDPALADSQVWILPDWTYIMFPKAEVFRMPLPDLVDQVRLGLRQVNRQARAWQDHYVSPETGKFVPLLSKCLPKPDPLPEPKPWKPKKFRSRKRKGEELRPGEGKPRV